MKPTSQQKQSRREPAGSGGGALAASRDVGMYGLRVRSTMDLCEWPDPPAGEPDVVVVEAPPVAPSPPDTRYSVCSTFEEHAVHIDVRGVARYAALDGSCIRVAPESGAKPEDVRLYLTGAMLGFIMHQRGILPLHASCVAIAGTGIAFAGPSGSGKSTLIAALLRRGATFVTDDICVVSSAGTSRSVVWPGAARLKLDGPGIDETENHADALEPAGGNRDKFHVPVSAKSVLPDPVPLSRVYLLGYDEGAARLERLSGLEAISALVDETYLITYVAAMGLTTQIFKQIAKLAPTIVVSRLIRPRGFEHLADVLDLIERDARDSTSQPLNV